MTTILVTGGTGTLGRAVVDRLLAQGQTPRVLSRRPEATPVPGRQWRVGDVNTGAGLDDAVDGVDAVVQCVTGFRGSEMQRASQVIAAARRHGSPHLVNVSIVGIDRIPLGYYRDKLAVERLVEDSGLPWSNLRATQFNDLVEMIVGYAARLPVLPLPRGLPFQPVSVRDVAVELVDLATAPAAGRAPDLGGPKVRDLPDLAAAYLAATGRRRRCVEVPAPGRLFAALRAGHHLTPANARGTITFEDHLATP